MKKLLWNQSFSVGNDIIDTQHKRLFELYNTLYSVINEDEDSHGVTLTTTQVISELSTYTIFHFREEERLLTSIHYKDIDAHKRGHSAFIAKLREYKLKNFSSDDTLLEELLEFIGTWLVEHIQIEDMHYSKEL